MYFFSVLFFSTEYFLVFSIKKKDPKKIEKKKKQKKVRKLEDLDRNKSSETSLAKLDIKFFSFQYFIIYFDFIVSTCINNEICVDLEMHEIKCVDHVFTKIFRKALLMS